MLHAELENVNQSSLTRNVEMKKTCHLEALGVL